MKDQDKTIIKGVVVADSMDKTVVVDVTRVKTHPLYHKKYSVNRQFKAHDEHNQYKIGDTVEMVSSRPLSKNKRHIVLSKNS